MGPSRSSATRRLAALVLTLGALAACGSDASTDAAPAAAEGAAFESAPATDSPLAFQNAAVGGGTIDFEALAGRPTALWFWAPY